MFVLRCMDMPHAPSQGLGMNSERSDSLRHPIRVVARRTFTLLEPIEASSASRFIQKAEMAVA
jgi:hypothetical protein